MHRKTFVEDPVQAASIPLKTFSKRDNSSVLATRARHIPIIAASLFSGAYYRGLNKIYVQQRVRRKIISLKKVFLLEVG